MCSLVMRPITSLAWGSPFPRTTTAIIAPALPHAPDYAEHNILLMSNLKIATRDIAQRYSSVGTLGSMTDPGVGAKTPTILSSRVTTTCRFLPSWLRLAQKCGEAHTRLQQ